METELKHAGDRIVAKLNVADCVHSIQSFPPATFRRFGIVRFVLDDVSPTGDPLSTHTHLLAVHHVQDSLLPLTGDNLTAKLSGGREVVA
ncbi:hypothetical protein ACIBSS_33475 [Micromonospora aurantiaca]|uniref:hypothetical protein n=1 Tax=Micromonospora aurantiaca (nom. illeg.) TaxID=47850 RepID=UPI0001BF16F3|nr:hypothetical protein [Micromonospora aurantiaca]